MSSVFGWLTKNVGFKWLTKSVGWKRKIAALLQTILALTAVYPSLLPYTNTVYLVAEWLGIVGLVHAGTKGTVTTKAPLSTIAACLGALDLAARNVPELYPYAETARTLTVVASMFATGSIIGSGKS